MLPMQYTKRAARAGHMRLKLAFNGLQQMGKRLGSVVVGVIGMRKRNTREEDAEKGRESSRSPAELSVDPLSISAPPTINMKASSEVGTERFGSPTPISPVSPTAKTAPTSPTSASPVPTSTSVASLSIAVSASETTTSTESGATSSLALLGGAAGTGVSSGTGAGRKRFANLVRNVITANKALGIYTPVAAPGSGGSTLSNNGKQRAKGSHGTGGTASEQEEHASYAMSATPRGASRVATLIPALKSLQPVQLFQPHTALVRHLQFSPNGEFLATCR